MSNQSNKGYTWVCYNNCGFGVMYVGDTEAVGIGYIYGEDKMRGKICQSSIADDLDNLKKAIKITINKYSKKTPTEFIEIDN